MRHGIVRYLKDLQRNYNYFRSAETEAVALQPKAPWLVTEKNVEDFEDQWLTCEHEKLSISDLHTRSRRTVMRLPKGCTAGMDTRGMVEGLQLATQEMKEVSGIYEASLGQRSNEVSGRAIQARSKESDVGSYVYTANFTLAIKHTGRILLDLIPNIYDAQRTIRIVGEDGKVDLVNINQQVMGIDHILNDVTVQAYDVSSRVRSELRDEAGRSPRRNDDLPAASTECGSGRVGPDCQCTRLAECRQVC